MRDECGSVEWAGEFSTKFSGLRETVPDTHDIAVGPKDVQSLYPGVALCPTHIRKAQKYTGNKGTEVAHRWHKEYGGYP